MAARSPSKPPQRPSLLYVDDHAASIDVVRKVLAEHDVDLFIAVNMDRAMTLARRKAPELMLVNVDLAAIGAAGLISLVHANPGRLTTPILALGTDAAAPAGVSALEAGFFLYLIKPLQSALFAEALGHALEFSARERADAKASS